MTRETQLQKVRQIMLLGSWVDLFWLTNLVGGSEAGISSRVRDLRKSKFGGYNIIKRRVSPHTFQYRLIQEA